MDAILARPAAPSLAPEAEVRPFVCLFLGQVEFGLPILRCREIVRVREITRMLGGASTMESQQYARRLMAGGGKSAGS